MSPQMFLLKRYRIFIIAAVLTAAALLMLLFNLRGTSEPGILRKMSLEMVSPLEYLINAPLRGLEDAWKRYIFLIGKEAENKLLKEKIARATVEIIKYREGYLEGVRLQKLLKLRETIPFSTVAARVAGRNPSPIFKMIIINRGQADGLRVGLPVVATAGVVGRILEASWHVSRVLLLTDENSNIDAVLQESRVQGILQGAAIAGGNLKYVSKTADVRIGDTVISSGMGGIFPKGLPLGVVRSASRKEADLFQRINVAPFVDPAGIEEVLVIMTDEIKK
jgi:rod shape-determining protein MreC